MSTIRENTRKIFEYLLAVKNLTVPVDRDLSKYNPLWWGHQLPNTEGCYHLGTGKNKEAWLEVHKQNIPSPPEPSKVLTGWVIGDTKNPTQKPKFHESLSNGSETILFGDFEERSQAGEQWLADWESWSSQYMLKYKVHKIYGELFALNQSFQRDGESIELVWGHGLLTWYCQGQRIRRPLFVNRMELSFDPQNGIFYIVPSDKGTWLETDMLSGLEIPNAERFSAMERSVQEEGIDPWDEAVMEPLCREIAHTLSPNGKVNYSNNIEQSTVANFSGNPTIYNCPLLFVRSRTGRQWQMELKGILEAIDNGYPIPATIAALTSTDAIETFLGQDALDSREDWKPMGEEILFPLAANDDQREIVKRLAANYGVSVQGPPGTGKSHTIANLICHLLAHGKRVLVTSHTERALKVLANKIPKSVRSLCVSVTGGDAHSIKEIEQAIRAISENLSMDTGKLNKEIAVSKKDLQETRSKLASLRLQLKRAAESEHSVIHFDDKDRMPWEIAQWLKENEQEHNWLPDSITIDTHIPPEENIVKLYKLAGQLHRRDQEALMQIRPDTKILPNSVEFTKLVTAWTEEEVKTTGSAKSIEGWKCGDEFYEEIDLWVSLVAQALDKLKRFKAASWLK